MLGKADLTHVWGVQPVHVDHDKLGVGIVAGNRDSGSAMAKAHGDDRVQASFGKAAQGLFALGFGLQFDLAIGAAGFIGPTLTRRYALLR